MAAPGIKGTLFANVVDEVNAALESSRLSRERLEAHLTSEDLGLLEQKISAVSWYDIFAYHRLVDLLCEVEASGDAGYWTLRGRRAANRMIESGLYQQLDYLGRTETRQVIDPDQRFRAFGRDLKLIMTLHLAMLNFGEWACVPDPDHERRYRIEIRGVSGIPDGVFMACAGLFSALGEMRGGTGWTCSRPQPDLVWISMDRSI
jgi:hypothetical protein